MAATPIANATKKEYKIRNILSAEAKETEINQRLEKLQINQFLSFW